MYNLSPYNHAPDSVLAFVCALHKQQRTLVVRSGKRLKIQIYFSEAIQQVQINSRGWKSLTGGSNDPNC